MTGPAFTNTMINAAAMDVQAEWVYQTVATNMDLLTHDDIDFCASLRGIEPLGYFV